MEEDDEPSGGITLIPLALAILAAVLGGAGLYFGLTANQRLTPLSTTLEAGTSTAATLEKNVAALETQLAELDARTDELKNALDRSRIYSNQSERALKQLAVNVRENREQIVKQVERLNELASTTQRPATNAAEGAPDEPAQAPEDAEPAANPGGQSYTIQSGDTFSSIASKTGVGLQALLDANPEADPRRLRIGDQINLPTE